MFARSVGRASKPYDPTVSALASERSPEERREALKEVLARTRACVRCAELANTRKSVVFGAGNADAELMFIGEAPGASEDEQGLPFVGRAGKLLQTLLAEIGLEREDVFIANVLKCHPPHNRDPQPAEIENCQEYLYGQVELIQPAIICTLGNFATKLLRGDPAGITRVHGQPQVITLGRRAVRLYPIYHPAAALYTPRMLETLREDFARLPGLLELGAPEQIDMGEVPQTAAEDALGERDGLSPAPEHEPGERDGSNAVPAHESGERDGSGAATVATSGSKAPGGGDQSPKAGQLDLF